MSKKKMILQKIKNLINKKQQPLITENTSPYNVRLHNVKNLNYITNLIKPQIDKLKENLDENSKKYVDFFIYSILNLPSEYTQDWKPIAEATLLAFPAELGE
jgi:hypothetical protein